MRLALVVIASILFAAPLCAQPDTTQLSETRAQLERARSEAERLLNSQADLYQQLESVDRELELSSRLLRQLRKESTQLKEAIAAIEDTLGLLHSTSQSESELAAQRLRRVFMLREVNYFDVPFVYMNQIDTERRHELTTRLIRSDSRRLVSLDHAITDKSDILADLQERQEQLARNTRAQTDESRRARESLRQRETLLAGLKKESRELALQVDQIGESSATLTEIFAQIESEVQGTGDYIWQRERDLNLKMKGRLYAPVNGPVVTRFGVSRNAKTGITSRANGVSFATSRGSNVVAALTGEVIYIGWARGLERFVVVDHGGSIYTVYGNLDQINVSEGRQVIRGEVFATAASGRLHFEVREGKTPVDPMHWLRH